MRSWTCKMKNIIFICKWNRLRSKVAEDYFNKINKNKNVKAESAGIFAGFLPLDQYQIDIAKEFGINLAGRTKGLDQIKLDNAYKIILVTDEIPEEVFKPRYSNKLIVWKTPDVKFVGDKEGARKIIQEIMNKVEELNNRFKENIK